MKNTTISPFCQFFSTYKNVISSQNNAINHFNDTPWLAWRTAFREVVKLLDQCNNKPTVESKYRLKKWCELGNGKNAEWVFCAANDAKEFMESKDDIMKSYDFEWLKNYYEQKYG